MYVKGNARLSNLNLIPIFIHLFLRTNKLGHICLLIFRVGHIYRSHMSFSVPGGHDVIGMNHYRIAELWMDEYKEYYLKHKPGLKGRSLGDDLEERRQIRTKLKCKSFKWYMENVAYDQGWYYPAVEPKPYATGRCRSKQKETVSVPNLQIIFRKSY